MRHNKFGLTALVLTLSGCSVVMEATRPDPVDLSSVAVGESRTEVLGRLGAPTTVGTVGADGQQCDVYQLYTKGTHSGGKAAIAATEAVADALTLCMAEVVSVPVEYATRNK